MESNGESVGVIEEITAEKFDWPRGLAVVTGAITVPPSRSEWRQHYSQEYSRMVGHKKCRTRRGTPFCLDPTVCARSAECKQRQVADRNCRDLPVLEQLSLRDQSTLSSHRRPGRAAL